MTEIELLEWVLANRKSGKRPTEGLLRNGSDVVARNMFGVAWDRPEIYTIAPRTRMVNGFEVASPMDVEPKRYEEYFFPSLACSDLCGRFHWHGDDFDLKVFKRGLCFSSEKDARDNAIAMMGKDPATYEEDSQ